MDRRGFVASIAVGAGIVGAGCTGGFPGDQEAETTTATAIDDHQFTKRRTSSREQTTEVSFDPETETVTVDGAMVVGSSSCNEAVLDRLEYDAGVLRARLDAAFVGRTDEDGTRACTDDVVWKEYELDVRFDEGLPDRVEVTVADGRGETRSVVEER